MDKLEESEVWSQILQAKDELGLRELAERFDVSVGQIASALRRTGTSRQTIVRPAPEPAQTPEPAASSKPAKKKRQRKSRGAKSKEHLIEPYVDLLGTVADSEIAAMAGVAPRTVFNFRKGRGIAPYRRGSDTPAPKKTKKKRGSSKIAAFHDLVGTIPDTELAERAGAATNTVRNYRLKHGIPSYRSQGGKRRSKTVEAPAAAVAAPAAPASPPSSTVAYEVVFADDTVRVVVGATLAAAAGRAEGAGLGDVVSLRRIASVI